MGSVRAAVWRGEERVRRAWRRVEIVERREVMVEEGTCK